MSPANPDANVDSTSAQEAGVALRYLRAYDAGKLSSLSIVSTFAGAAVIDEADNSVVRAIKVDTAST